MLFLTTIEVDELEGALEPMTLSSEPLRGTDLVDCAKANENQDVETAAQRCGYSDVATFEQELKNACNALGIEIQGFKDLAAMPQTSEPGIEIAPESPTRL